MKTLAEQKKIISSYRNKFHNSDTIDQNEVYEYFEELRNLDFITREYQKSLYYGRNLKSVRIIGIIFVMSIIILGLWSYFYK